LQCIFADYLPNLFDQAFLEIGRKKPLLVSLCFQTPVYYNFDFFFFLN
jgi:hypothetical protein